MIGIGLTNYNIYTVEPPIKDTPNKGHNNIIEITSKQSTRFQSTRFNVPNGDFPIDIIFLTSDNGQPLNKGQTGQKTMGPKRVRYSEVPLY